MSHLEKDPAEVEGLVDRGNTLTKGLAEWGDNEPRLSHGDWREINSFVRDATSRLSELKAENEQLRASAEQGWAQQRYWSDRYIGAAERRDKAEAERDAWKADIEALDATRAFMGNKSIARAAHTKLKGEA